MIISYANTHKACEKMLVSEGYLPVSNGEGWLKGECIAFIACSNNYGKQKKRNFIVIRSKMLDLIKPI